jgi:hypothetical protein
MAFVALTAMKIQVTIFWVVTPHSDVHVSKVHAASIFTLKMEAAWSKSLQDITIQKTANLETMLN